MKGPARRAQALRELAHLLESGLDAGRALASLGDGVAAGGTRAGLVDGLEAAGLLVAREAAFVRAMETAGRVDAGLVQVAADLERRARIQVRLRRSLAVPLALLAIAAVVAPLPAAVRGELDAGGYLFAVAGTLAPALLVLWLGLRQGVAVVAGLGRLAASLGRAPPVAVRRRLFAGLGRLLEGGVDAATALGTLAAGEDRVQAERLRRAAERTRREGAAVTEALAAAGLLAPAADRGMVGAGEAAGRLPAALRHRADQLGEILERRAALAAEWLPRLVYTLVVVWIGARIL